MTPGVVYAAFSGAVGRSTDGGATWAMHGAGLPEHLLFPALAVDPVDPSTICAASLVDGVFKSEDASSTWSQAAPRIEGAIVRDVVVDPADPTILYLATENASVVMVEQSPE